MMKNNNHGFSLVESMLVSAMMVGILTGYFGYMAKTKKIGARLTSKWEAQLSADSITDTVSTLHSSDLHAFLGIKQASIDGDGWYTYLDSDTSWLQTWVNDSVIDNVILKVRLKDVSDPSNPVNLLTYPSSTDDLNNYDREIETTVTFKRNTTDDQDETLVWNKYVLHPPQSCENVDPIATDPTIIGFGTLASPYLICTATQFNAIGLDDTLWDKFFALGQDIDMAPVPVGGSGGHNVIAPTDLVRFRGEIDGRGYRIENFVVGNVDYGGPIGTAQDSTVRNLLVRNLVANSSGFGRGGIIAWGEDVTIKNSSSTGTINNSSSGTGSGGIIGTIYSNTKSSRVEKSWSDVTISGLSTKGGIVGHVYGSHEAELEEVWAKGNVTSGSDEQGGLVGSTGGDLSLLNCYSSGNVTGGTAAGGIIGHANTGTVTVENCYARGTITQGSSFFGGIIGVIGGSTVTVSNSFWDLDSNPTLPDASDPVPNPIDLPGASSLTGAARFQQSTYSGVGWKFQSPDLIWLIEEGVAYPTLANVPEN